MDSTLPPDDDEELFPVMFTENDRKNIKIILGFYLFVTMGDEENSIGERDFIMDIVKEFKNALNTFKDELIDLPEEYLIVLYQSLKLALYIRHTVHVKKKFKVILVSEGIEPTIPAVEKACKDSRYAATDYILYLDHEYGYLPIIKKLQQWG